jgi:hypothetical protein
LRRLAMARGAAPVRTWEASSAKGDIGISVGGAGRGRPPEAAARRAGLEAVEKVFTAWIWSSGFIAGRTPPGDRVTNRPVTLMEVLHLGHRTMVT